MDQADFQWARPYLNADEQILWRGKPAKLHIYERADIRGTLFGVLWTGLLVFRIAIPAVRSGQINYTWIMIGLLLLVGFYWIAGRFIHKAVQLHASSYVVTSDRVLIQVRGKVKAYSKSNLPPMKVLRYSDGQGTIVFQQLTRSPRRSNNSFIMDMSNVIHGVTDVDAALRAINTKNL